MKVSIRSLLLLLLLTTSTVLHSEDTVYKFKDDLQEQRYQDLINELRCLVCQNQTLADSNAELAQDLRHEVYEMIVKGGSDDAIIEFLVNRYGDFVLYRPPLKQTTWVLWFGPLLMMIFALVAAFRIIINRKTENSGMPVLSDEERKKLADLLNQPEAGGSEEKC